MHLKAIKISHLTTKNNVFLAPLAGYTNAVFRDMCFDLGAGLTFTEMVSAKGLYYKSENTRELLKILPDYNGINAVQIFGNDPFFMRAAAENGHLAPFELIDINMGCPVPKIYKNGEGSALMGNIPLAQKIVSEVKKSGKAVSVKFRTGLDGKNLITRDFAVAMEQAGADMITIHGRTRDKIYSGEVNYDEIAAAKSAVKIPVIANGGVFSKEDAEKLADRTGADGIALARGAMYNPFLFAEITGAQVDDKRAVIQRQLDMTFEHYDSRFATVFMRKMIAFYIKGTPNATQTKLRLFKAENKEQIGEILADCIL
ncbi:MAG: tRNA dihydrouridine synthase [Candidatus Coproplasma sp.]